jgi:hypothetical protein
MKRRAPRERRDRSASPSLAAQLADLEHQLAAIQRRLDELRAEVLVAEAHPPASADDADPMRHALRDSGFQAFLLRRLMADHDD